MSLAFEEMMVIKPHPSWHDGRGCYNWYRFDARLGGLELCDLRAEVTWNDDIEQYNLQLYGSGVTFFHPELKLETNLRRYDETGRYVLETAAVKVLDLTDAEAIAIVQGDATHLLKHYAAVVKDLVARSK